MSPAHRGPPGRATMLDVAAAAGVSLKSVSRVVNDEPGVSRSLAEKVHRAVAELGYRHNLAASNLRRGRRTGAIGMLVQDLSNGFCAEALRAVEDRARERGFVMMAASSDEDGPREREVVAGLVARRVDGLLLMPTSRDLSWLAPRSRRAPGGRGRPTPGGPRAGRRGRRQPGCERRGSGPPGGPWAPADRFSW